VSGGDAAAVRHVVNARRWRRSGTIIIIVFSTPRGGCYHPLKK
jgi:hypothetical protein